MDSQNSNVFEDQIAALNQRLEALGQEFAQLVSGQQKPNGVTLGERLADVMDAIDTARKERPLLQQRAKTAASIADARRVEYDANEHKAVLNAVLGKINALRSEVMTAIGETDRVKGRAFDTHNRLVQNLRHEGAKEDEIRDVLERADKALGR